MVDVKAPQAAGFAPSPLTTALMQSATMNPFATGPAFMANEGDDLRTALYQQSLRGANQTAQRISAANNQKDKEVALFNNIKSASEAAALPIILAATYGRGAAMNPAAAEFNQAAAQGAAAKNIETMSNALKNFGEIGAVPIDAPNLNALVEYFQLGSGIFKPGMTPAQQNDRLGALADMGPQLKQDITTARGDKAQVQMGLGLAPKEYLPPSMWGLYDHLYGKGGAMQAQPGMGGGATQGMGTGEVPMGAVPTQPEPRASSDIPQPQGTKVGPDPNDPNAVAQPPDQVQFASKEQGEAVGELLNAIVGPWAMKVGEQHFMADGTYRIAVTDSGGRHFTFIVRNDGGDVKSVPGWDFTSASPYIRGN